MPSYPLLPSSAYAVLLATVMIAALYFGRSVFVPLALAVLLSFVLSPLVVVLRRWRVPRIFAVAIVVSGFVAALIGLGVSMGRQVTELAGDLPRYETTLRQKLKSLRSGVTQTGIVDKAATTLKELGRELDQAPPTSSAGPATTITKPIPVEIHEGPERPLDTYQRIVSALLAPLTTMGIVLVLIVFILMQREDIRDRVIRLVGARDIERTTTALDDAGYRLSRLFLAQAALNTGFGAVITIGLWLIGVPSPLLWGIVAGLMRFVPYIGAILAAVFPILLAAAVDPGWTMVAWTAALFIIVEPAVGHFLEPYVQGQSTGLSPLAIVFSAILWTALWGPIGLLLATPLTICLVVLGRHVEGLAFLDVILGDQPALTPPQVFYQRMLARTSAEAEEQALKVLKTSSLLAYYDGVALPGLQLASIDAQRGVIDEDRMADLREGVALLVEDLADAPLGPLPSKSDDVAGDDDAAQPTAIRPVTVGEFLPDWRASEDPVVCLAARTHLDAAAAELLADAIRKHGIRARPKSVTRLSELGTDLKDAKLVWISSIDATQSHTQVRYLIRRLHRLAPQATLCGGYWDGMARQASKDDSGISHHASTFADAVAITVSLATGNKRQNVAIADEQQRPLTKQSA